jgi:DNA-directed RNA polymerase specialized sigma24 family protein
MRIMFNLFVDRCRHRTCERLSDLPTLDHLPAPKTESPLPWQDLEPNEVAAALKRLPQSYQVILDLYFRHQRPTPRSPNILESPPPR